MKPARVGNAMVDGVAIGPEQEQIAIEVKSPRDDIVRGIGQCFEALAAGYTRAVLVTTLRVAKRLRNPFFPLDCCLSMPLSLDGSVSFSCF